MGMRNRELELMRAAESAQSSSNRYLSERDVARRELEEANKLLKFYRDANDMYRGWVRVAEINQEAYQQAFCEANRILRENGIEELDNPSTIPF